MDYNFISTQTYCNQVAARKASGENCLNAPESFFLTEQHVQGTRPQVK